MVVLLRLCRLLRVRLMCAPELLARIHLPIEVREIVRHILAKLLRQVVKESATIVRLSSLVAHTIECVPRGEVWKIDVIVEVMLVRVRTGRPIAAALPGIPVERPSHAIQPRASSDIAEQVIVVVVEAEAWLLLWPNTSDCGIAIGKMPN